MDILFLANSSFFNFSDTVHEIYKNVSGWFNSLVLSLPRFVVALIVFFLFILFSRYVYRLTIKLLQRHGHPHAIHFTLARLLRIIIIGIGFFIALGVLHLDKVLTTILASAGILGLAASFAVQGLLKNTVSGFILSFMPEIKIGDWVETQGFAGDVLEVNLRNIVIKESDNNFVVIPNSQIVQSPFKNFTSTDRSRVVINARVGLDADLALVEKIIKATIEENYPQKEKEEVEVYYEEFGHESVKFIVRFWTEVTRMRHYRIARHRAIQLIKNTLDENGIRIPVPVRTLEYDKKEG